MAYTDLKSGGVQPAIMARGFLVRSFFSADAEPIPFTESTGGAALNGGAVSSHARREMQIKLHEMALGGSTSVQAIYATPDDEKKKDDGRIGEILGEILNAAEQIEKRRKEIEKMNKEFEQWQRRIAAQEAYWLALAETKMNQAERHAANIDEIREILRADGPIDRHRARNVLFRMDTIMREDLSDADLRQFLFEKQKQESAQRAEAASAAEKNTDNAESAREAAREVEKHNERERDSSRALDKRHSGNADKAAVEDYDAYVERMRREGQAFKDKVCKDDAVQAACVAEPLPADPGAIQVIQKFFGGFGR